MSPHAHHRRPPLKVIRQMLGDERGAAAAELALWILFFIIPVFSTLDVGMYAYQRLQVEAAAHNAAEAIRSKCASLATPVTKNCSGITAAATTAAQSTSLGTAVTLSSGYPKEGYYCVDGSSALIQEPASTVGTVESPPTKAAPFDCSSVGGNTTSPGTYIRVSVTYDYTPLFESLSVASLLTTPIVRESWVRLD